ncbi:MAG: ferrous iron transport protein A [Marivibrio sp.]|uniref:FeoA family protein n=1 Tax=Marivibrio sp. TaxID=2039719 RepID=UPI0032F04041
MTEDGIDGGAALPLAMAREGDWVRVTRVSGGPRMEKRLTDLGLNVGAEVMVSQRQGGGLIVVRGDLRLAVGAGAAQKILVAPTGRGEGE